ncbi:hypothetical protein F5Y10DRAFT_244392 [Nemania abortiva]|nr:hypothetical protein F5Y10DRAFT_244392 [Nemania abortiva]
MQDRPVCEAVFCVCVVVCQSVTRTRTDEASLFLSLLFFPFFLVSIPHRVTTPQISAILRQVLSICCHRPVLGCLLHGRRVASQVLGSTISLGRLVRISKAALKCSGLLYILGNARGTDTLRLLSVGIMLIFIYVFNRANTINLL